MTDKKIKARIGILALIVFVVVFSRLLPYIFGIELALTFNIFGVEQTFNFSPLAAIALFGGAYFVQKSNALIFPLVALWCSNMILDNVFLSEYYDGFVLFANWEVYLAIAAVVGLAFFMLKKVTIPNVIAASLMASVLFFLITNFVVWLTSGMYQLTFAGLSECFAMAIPFFRNTLIGDLVFTCFLFGAYELVIAIYPKFALKSA